jgi:hypothetical protein
MSVQTMSAQTMHVERGGGFDLHFVDPGSYKLRDDFVSLPSDFQREVLACGLKHVKADINGKNITVVGNPDGGPYRFLPNFGPKDPEDVYKGVCEYAMTEITRDGGCCMVNPLDLLMSRLSALNSAPHNNPANDVPDFLHGDLFGSDDFGPAGSHDPYHDLPNDMSSDLSEFAAGLIRIIARSQAKRLVDKDGKNARCACGEPDCELGKAIEEEKRKRGLGGDSGGLTADDLKKIDEMIFAHLAGSSLALFDEINNTPANRLARAAINVFKWGTLPFWGPVWVALKIVKLMVDLVVVIVTVAGIVFLYPVIMIIRIIKPNRIALFKLALGLEQPWYPSVVGTRIGLWLRGTRIAEYMGALFHERSYLLDIADQSAEYYGAYHRSLILKFFGWIAWPFRKVASMLHKPEVTAETDNVENQ